MNFTLIWWVKTTCSLTGGHKYFEGTYCQHLQRTVG